MSDTEDEYPNVGVAISTTGDPHRLPFLESNTLRWVAAMPPSAPVFVTVDGDEEAAERAAAILRESPLDILTPSLSTESGNLSGRKRSARAAWGWR